MTGGYSAIVVPLPDEDGMVSIRRLTCPAGDDASYEFIKGHIKGWLEHLATSDGTIDFWNDEEGKCEHKLLPVNYIATDIFRAYFPWRPEQVWPGGPGEPFYVGTVVITGNDGSKAASVPDGLWDELKAMPKALPDGNVWIIYRDGMPVWMCPVEFIDEVADD